MSDPVDRRVHDLGSQILQEKDPKKRAELERRQRSLKNEQVPRPEVALGNILRWLKR